MCPNGTVNINPFKLYSIRASKASIYQSMVLNSRWSSDAYIHKRTVSQSVYILCPSSHNLPTKNGHFQRYINKWKIALFRIYYYCWLRIALSFIIYYPCCTDKTILFKIFAMISWNLLSLREFVFGNETTENEIYDMKQLNMVYPIFLLYKVSAINISINDFLWE